MMIEKAFEIGLQEGKVREAWRQFQRTRAELSNAEARFDALGEARTRVTLSGEDASVEGTADEFQKFAGRLR